MLKLHLNTIFVSFATSSSGASILSAVKSWFQGRLSASGAQTIAKIPAAQAQPNRYIRNVKQSGKTYEEHTEFSLSDHAVSEIAPFVVGQMMSRSSKPSYPGNPSPPAPFQQPLVNLNDALPEVETPQLSEAIDHRPLEANGSGAARYQKRYSVQT